MSPRKKIINLGLPFSDLGINSEIFQTIQKLQQMKKFFAIAVIAIAFVACNNDAEKKDTADTTVVVAPVDTVVVAPVDTVVVAPADTTATTPAN